MTTKSKFSVRDVINSAREELKEELSRPVTPRETLIRSYSQYGIKLKPLKKPKVAPVVSPTKDGISKEYQHFAKRLQDGDFLILRLLHNRSQEKDNDYKFYSEEITQQLVRLYRKLLLEKNMVRDAESYSLKKLFVVGVLKNVSFECEENQELLDKLKFMESLLIELKNEFEMEVKENEIDFSNAQDVPCVKLEPFNELYLIELLSLIRNIVTGKSESFLQVLHYVYNFFYIDSEEIVLTLLRIFSKACVDMKTSISNLFRLIFHHAKKYGANMRIKSRGWYVLTNLLGNNKKLITTLSDAEIGYLVDELVAMNERKVFDEHLVKLISNIGLNKQKNYVVCSNEKISVLNEFLIELSPSAGSGEFQSSNPTKHLITSMRCIANLSYHITPRNVLFVYKKYFVKNLLALLKTYIKDERVLAEILKTLVNFSKDDDIKVYLSNLNIVKGLGSILKERFKNKKLCHLILGLYTNFSSSEILVPQFEIKLLIAVIRLEKGNDKQTQINNLALKTIANITALMQVKLTGLDKKASLLTDKENLEILDDILQS